MVRSLVKTGICGILHNIGLDRLAGTIEGISKEPVVLGFHRVVADFHAAAPGSIPGMIVSRRMFEQQLDWLGRHFQFLSLDELGSTLERIGRFQRPVVAITFDDGYRDNYDHAFPILMRKGIPAAVFVTTDLIDSQEPPVHDRLYHALQFAIHRWQGRWRGVEQLIRHNGIDWEQFYEHSRELTDPLGAARLLLSTLPHDDICRIIAALENSFQESEKALCGCKPLTWAMISEMASAGITIGSHTQSHVLLPNERKDRVTWETSGSRRRLEEHLGTSIRHFAYPGGCFNHEAVLAVAAAGYRYAYTTCRHRDPEYPLLTIPRRTFWEASSRGTEGMFSPAVMGCQLNGVLDVLGGERCRDHEISSKEHSGAAQPRRAA